MVVFVFIKPSFKHKCFLPGQLSTEMGGHCHGRTGLQPRPAGTFHRLSLVWPAWQSEELCFCYLVHQLSFGHLFWSIETYQMLHKWKRKLYWNLKWSYLSELYLGCLVIIQMFELILALDQHVANCKAIFDKRMWLNVMQGVYSEHLWAQLVASIWKRKPGSDTCLFCQK